MQNPKFLFPLQAREFANELRASTKASRNPTVWLEGAAGAAQNVSNADTSTVSEAYAKMLTIFIPLLVDEVGALLHSFLTLSNCDCMSSSFSNLFSAPTAEFLFCTLHVL